MSVCVLHQSGKVRRDGTERVTCRFSDVINCDDGQVNNVDVGEEGDKFDAFMFISIHFSLRFCFSISGTGNVEN